MRRIFILVCLITRACFVMQTVQHFYISRKARSNLKPVQTGYAYTQVNDEPAKFSTFYNKLSDRSKKKDSIDSALKLDDKKLKEKCTQCFHNKYNNRTTGPPATEKDSNDAQRSENQNIAASNIESIYDMNHDFHTDDEDIRTDSRNYYGWPYLYHSLYEYEPMNFNIEYEKAKDKRFISPDADRVIPVHESVDEDIPDSQMYSGSGYKDMNVFTTDNPNYGNQPFFSYVLNDYFDKTYDDDSLHFKGIPWAKEIDHKIPFKDIYDSSKRVRRLDDNNPEYSSDISHDHDTLQESVTRKSYDSDHDSNINGHDKNNKHSYTGDYKENEQNYRGFKDFADAFLNRFGSEDQNKVAKYSIKNNSDKGEKKKGFRKVYHKDEYQEHNEFFDDNNSSVKNEENGESKVRVGGSEGLLRSQAVAALGNNQNKLNKEENIANNNYDKEHVGRQRHKGIENYYNQYRDLVKDAAFSNNADYFNI